MTSRREFLAGAAASLAAAKARTTELLLKLEARDPELMAVWSETRQWSLDDFTEIYAWCGVHFDRIFFESEVDEPGLKLVGDITYIPTWQRWVYLATVLDCCTKKVVGYAMAEHMRTELVVDALKMAIINGHTRHGETIFHSDRGTQYMSAEFAEFTRDAGIVRSVGRTGICYDNAWAESFNATLKVERVHRTVYPTRRHAIGDIARYIELRYNQRRLHSALQYRTPNEAEQDWYETNKAA